jgi:glutathione S-transferase
MPYTIPTILLPSGEYVMDSKKIAQRLETLYPSPPVHLDHPVLTKLEEIMSQRFFPPMRPILLDRVPKRILGDASIPYWVRTRSAMVGKPLDEFCAEHTHEECFAKAEPAIREITALLEENGANGEGPFFLGKEVSYVDFVWAGCLFFWKRNGEDVFEELLRRSGNAEAHRKLLEGVAPWAKRDAE